MPNSRNRFVLLSLGSLLAAAGCTQILGEFSTDANVTPGGDGGLQDGTTPNGDAAVLPDGAPLPEASMCTETPCVRDIAAGITHTCAVLEGGQVRCWGDNAYGATSVGTVTDAGFSGPRTVTKPTNVGAAGATTVTAGGAVGIFGFIGHSCVLREGKGACFGSNSAGQLGRLPENLAANPEVKPVEGLANARIVKAGAAHTCAILENENVACWGYGATGGLGRILPNGEDSDPVPRNVTLPLNVKAAALAVGYEHTCVLTTDKEVYCWGQAKDGALGNGRPDGGQSTPQATPKKVASLANVKAIAAGPFDTCALTETGRVYCFGQSEPTGGPTERLFPGGINMTQLAMSYGGTCALATNGQVWCWGDNRTGQTGTGQLGDSGTYIPEDVPTPIAPVADLPTDLVRIAGGGQHYCAVTKGGAAYCWGFNTFGQLGNQPPIPPDASSPPARTSVKPVRVKFD